MYLCNAAFRTNLNVTHVFDYIVKDQLAGRNVVQVDNQFDWTGFIPMCPITISASEITVARF